MVSRVACFLTCGYTEAGAMQFFLRKINDSYEYKQYLPNKTIKKKGDAKIIKKEISGLTGEALLKKIYSILEKHKDEINTCKAVLIEDDLDGRFHNWDNKKIKGYRDAIVDKVHSKLESDIPVFILYASPEAESWFIADWDNGFGYLYGKSNRIKDMDQKAKSFFLHHLRDYIYSEVLKEYSHNIEDYGWFENGYIKLSDQIISVIQTNIKDYVRTLPQANSDCVKQIIESRDLYYSKKLHGDIMLRSISPDVVAEKCRQYFMGTYNELAYFGDNNV